MLRYKTETRPSLVALYDIRPGNGSCPFLQPRSPHGAIHAVDDYDCGLLHYTVFNPRLIIVVKLRNRPISVEIDETLLKRISD